MFAESVAVTLNHLSPKHRLIAIHNLKRSFPEKSIGELERIAAESYRSFALLAAEFFEIPYLTRANLDEFITIKGLDHYLAACGEEKGVLLFGAHFGNWEIGNAALALTTNPFVFIHRNMDNTFLERNVTAVRASYGNVSLSKEKAMRRMIRLLSQGATINLLIDQNIAWQEGVFVNFFGHQAATTSGLALLAMHTGAPVLPTFTIRRPDGKYVLEIGKKLDIVHTGSHENDVVANTQQFTEIIEQTIRKYPEQWLWVHQRWKTKRFQVRKSAKCNRERKVSVQR